jgi:uroporphyrinogen-III synthase
VRGSLEGRVVLVTRPRDQVGPLVGLLRIRGATPIVAPAIQIVPTWTRELRRALEELAAGEFEWVTLTSRATVEMLRERLRPREVRAKVAAVGDGTAAAYRRWTRRWPDLVPPTFTTQALARAFPRGRGKVLCARADIAPDGLEEALARKGWAPTRIAAYRTRVPRTLPAEARRALGEGRVDAITFTSASTVAGFAALAGPVGGHPKVVCIGPVTAQAARAHGFRVAAVAKPHTIEGVVAALERALAPRTRSRIRR